MWAKRKYDTKTGLVLSILSAPAVMTMKYFLCVMGMVLIVEGLPYFAFPEKIKAYLAKISEVPDGTLRLIGLVSMIAGLVLLYFGRT